MLKAMFFTYMYVKGHISELYYCFTPTRCAQIEYDREHTLGTFQ